MFAIQISSVLARNVFLRRTFGPTLNFFKLLFSRNTKNAGNTSENNTNMLNRFLYRNSLKLHLGFNVIDIFGDTCVHAGIAGFAAFVAERDDADLCPPTLDTQHKRPTRITLTRVLATLTVTRAQKIAVNILAVRRVTILVSPHRQDRLSLHSALFSTYYTPCCILLFQ